MGWLRCSLSFSLLRSSIQCLHGALSAIGQFVKTPPVIDLVRAESQFSVHYVSPRGSSTYHLVLRMVGKGSLSSLGKKLISGKPVSQSTSYSLISAHYALL